MTAAGCRWGVSWGLEVPLYFAPSPGFLETPTLKRSNAHPIVGAECRAGLAAFFNKKPAPWVR